MTSPGRNDPCPCGSGRKFKKCCENVPAASRYQNAAASLSPSLHVELAALGELFRLAQYRVVVARASHLTQYAPSLGVAWKLLGVAQIAINDHAIPALQEAARLLPCDAEVQFYLGVAWSGLGKLIEAEACYKKAIDIFPEFAQAFNNLAGVQKDRGQAGGAAASYSRALQIDPGNGRTHYNFAILLDEMGRLDDAICHYREAIRIEPDLAEAHNNLANTLLSAGHTEEAEEACRQALTLNPTYAEASNNLGNILKEAGRIPAAEACYRRALDLWPGYSDAHSNLLMTLNYSPDHSAESRFVEAQRFGAAMACHAKPFTSWPGLEVSAGEQNAPLRVGLVSGDLRQHSVGHFLEGLLAHVDPARLALLAFPTQSQFDALSARIRPRFTQWLPLANLNDETAACLIRSQGVQVLLDLSGHTAHNRLPMFAWRPAPVQASWLGYLATTGLAEMDWYLADGLTMPTEDEVNFTERIWRLPGCYVCFTPPASDRPVAPLPALTNGFITFGSFNNLSKMNDAVVALWARVLRTVPGSRLFLKSRPLAEGSLRASVAARFATHGIAPERLILEGFTATREDHLAAYDRVDLTLDPFPYAGTTTTVEALWMGVPVLSLAGERIISRQGVTLLTNAGLPDWIAPDADALVDLAKCRASSLDALSGLRQRLRQQVLASPVFDAPRFARNFEAALMAMWQEKRRQLAS